MFDLYLLLHPVHDILDQWLETHDPVHRFTNHMFDKADYVFSNKENYDFKKVNEMGPVVKFSTWAEAMPGLEFHPTKLTIMRRLSKSEAEDNVIFEMKWEGATRVLKVNRQTVDDELDGEDRHLTELNMYNHFLQSGLYTMGVGIVPHPYSYVHIWGHQHLGWVVHREHWPYDSWLQQFTNPADYPRGILLEYIPNMRLPMNQFTTQNIYDLLDTLAKVYAAGVVHRDLKARDMLWDGARFVIIDFERAVLFEEDKLIEKAGTMPDLHDLWRSLVLHKW
ncbi:hypothetical protein EWM64_g10762 [Hericium alpestre]|uniref:Protein kinase domain-containing protein n=1 Tax=Hericium alpestre TaxID=135208 RepID=A0A4Y9ZGE8_9AGAM|nr:hypothetical protein EWM64_g10762 [Hericium alpestre]